jgi:hypothetical protein
MGGPLPFLAVNELVPLDQSMPPDLSFLGLSSNDDASPVLPPFAENLEKTLLFNPSLNLATRTDPHSCSNDVASAASSHQLRQVQTRKRKAHRDSFLSNDVASVASSHSDGRHRVHDFQAGPQSVSTQSNRKACRRQSRKHLQKVALATESVSTQPRKPANKGSDDVQEASKVTPTKPLKNSSFDGVDSGLSSDDDPSTGATPHFPTDASFDERKPAFKTTPCDSNESIRDAEGNPGDYDNTDAFDGVEDTEFDFVQDVKNTLMDNDSVHEDDNDEETHPEVDMELEDKGDGVPSNQDDVEPSANVPEIVDKPRSALDENQPDHLINTRLPKPSMKYETIPVYNFLPSQAPQRQAYLLFE